MASLEDRGVSYAVNDAKESSFRDPVTGNFHIKQDPVLTRQEYGSILHEHNCSRKRIFGVDSDVGTFNFRTDRSRSNLMANRAAGWVAGSGDGYGMNPQTLERQADTAAAQAAALNKSSSEPATSSGATTTFRGSDALPCNPLGQKGCHPRLDYSHSDRVRSEGKYNNTQDFRSLYARRNSTVENPLHQLNPNGWPNAARGGHIHMHGEPGDNPERKFGSLKRNIAGDCTVKDQFSYYYGNTGTVPARNYYGVNAGSRNMGVYVNRAAQDPM